MIGQIILHYKIIEKLSAGGMGVVYRARDMTLERDVALKFLQTQYTSDRARVPLLSKKRQEACGTCHTKKALFFLNQSRTLGTSAVCSIFRALLNGMQVVEPNKERNK